MRIALTLTAVAAAVGLLTACTTLPTDTEPQALRSFEPQVVEQTDLGPQPGQEPDLLLRDFYTASAHPVQDYQSARSFLTTETEEQWNPSESILVVDRIDLITQPGSTSERRSFNVRGSVVGRIATGGSWSAYYYNGYIYSNDIAKGFDVLKIDDRRTDPARGVHMRELNVQTQPDYFD